MKKNKIDGLKIQVQL